MIPKIIHYCWFGKSELPEDTRRFIEGWRRLCPDYEIKEWNEENFPIDFCTYSREAYQMKNWAFVSDVCRLYALSTFGGIYLDTDIELVKPFDSMLGLHSFFGTEDTEGGDIGMGVVGAEPHTEWIDVFLEYYKRRHFINRWGHPDRTPNPTLYKRFIEPKLKAKDKPYLFDKDYFYPKPVGPDKYEVTAETVTIHHYAASWRRHRTLIDRVKIILHGLKVRYLGR